MLAPSAYLASAASTLLLQQSILPDIIWSCIHTPAPAIHTPRYHLDARRSVGGVYGYIMDRSGQLTKTLSANTTTQKAWDGPVAVAANQKNLILSRAPSDVDKARLIAAASPRMHHR